METSYYFVFCLHPDISKQEKNAEHLQKRLFSSNFAGNNKQKLDDFDLVMMCYIYEKYAEQLEMPRESAILNLPTWHKCQTVLLTEQRIVTFSACDKLLQHLDY